MLRIATDGAADMPKDWEKKYDIHILYQGVYFKGKDAPEEFDFTKQDFYQVVKERGEIPKTSFPSALKVQEFYRSIAQRGDTILSIHVSNKLSGTFSAFQAAAKELANEFKIITMDSYAGSSALGFMCREARILDQVGATLQEIIERLEKIRRNIMIVFTLDTLEFARWSGRVNALQSAVVSMLKIKPIIELQDGLLVMTGMVRTRQKSLERILEIVKERVGEQKINLGIVHAIDPETAVSLLEKAKKILCVKDAIITELTIPVAANLGPGTVGIVAYPIEGK